MKKKKKCVKYCCYYFIFINTKNITQPQISAIPARSPSRVPFRVVRSCIFFSFCPASFLCALQREMQKGILENQFFFCLFVFCYYLFLLCFVFEFFPPFGFSRFPGNLFEYRFIIDRHLNWIGRQVTCPNVMRSTC